ncbi:amino acid ABC transporter ATP-binding/permease protein [Psychrobacter sanguinis]|uniref:amino acid ABC transporter ATP-binding/permease protein n=1 Tax=Psychrobacter sanguinis TaxID=861445 RepID=UPI001917BEF0|nr:ATP-binding cassette domain-containing protein [Psychrobacter sanguinis]MCC3346047.1 ATP-binding cassette domain-containing protein [Psychrobacter sanguinis]MDY3306076.1 ATP-binding cassette domain-containing protein [Psychrobacter sanguinis]
MSKQRVTESKVNSQQLSDSAAPTPVFRLRDMFKPSFDLWVFSWILGLVTALSMIALLMISGWFITGAALAGMIAVGSHAFNYMLPAGIIRMLAMARTAGRYGELIVSHNAVFDLLKTLRLRFFNRLAALPLIQQRNTLHASQYMHRLVNDIDKLDEFILRVISPWLVGSVSVLLLALFISWALPVSAVSKITIYLLLLLALLLPLIVSLRGINRAKKLSQVSEARRQRLLAPLAIITQLLLWRQWQTQTKSYIAQDNELQKLEWSAQKLRSTVMLLIQWFFYAAILVVLFSIFQLSTSATSPQAVLNNIDVPLVLAVTLGLLGIQEIIVPLGQHYLALGNSVSAKDRLNALLTVSELEPNSEKTIFDNRTDENYSASNHKLKNYAGLKLPTGPLNAKLTQVSAKIPNALVGAQDVNISMHSGTPLIIKGPSGCGKSTLLQALAGELPLTSGHVTLNDANWFDYDWQDQLGYLGQQLDIFDQTLAANLRLGKPDATDDELLVALDKVGLLPWLHAQPQGLDTPLGEYGAAISGGQARRVALARLLLKPRRVLLLDEPFAGLDVETREKVWHSVRVHQQQDLLIVVNHHEWDMGQCDVLRLKENVFID